ncbi:MAG: acetyl-CoA carboxylase biotin carboxyl carrier protein subunit [Acidobacteriota bacterium]|nr:acetyl-CoA carboxylase biotin carboxyl carrier protein subunit [Acidobacteriota bacterium]
MIKLKAEVAGKDHQISIQRRETVVLAEVDGRRYKLEFRDLGDSEYLLIDGHTVYNCRVESSHNHPDHIEVSLRGVSYPVRLSDPKRLRSAQCGAEHDKGAARIVAPMPGKVVRLLVEAGAEVEAGAGILVVEAMKMQNEMKAPKAGYVVSIHAQVGSTVNAGEVLAVIE